MSSVPLPPSPPQADSNAEQPPTPQISFWQTPFAQNVVPILSSVFIHLAIIVFGVIFLRTAQAVYRAVVQEQVIIPDSTLAESGPAGGIPNPGLGEDPNRAAAQDSAADIAVSSQGWAERPSQTLTRALMGDTSDAQAESMISIGGASSIGRSTGAGNVTDGGQLAPFGIPGGGGGNLGPKVSFIGVGGNARKIVYLVDASGSMIDARERLKAALASSIDKLMPIQEFNIVVFRDEDVLTLQKDGLIRATTANKQQAFRWIEEKYTVSGTTEPMSAIRATFGLRPELVYVLTDGFDQIASFDDVKAEFLKQNRDKKVKVNTLLIRSRSDKELERVMQEIAEQNGGVYKPIERNDF